MPATFFAPAVSALLYPDEQRRVVAEGHEMGLLYDSSLMADYDAYELLEAGEPIGIIELPVEWIRDDAVYFNMNWFAALRPYTAPATVLDIFQREFDGTCGAGGCDPRTVHRFGRAMAKSCHA